MTNTPPVATAHLFPGLHGHLVATLRSLGREDWSRPTVAGAWEVRDVVAHLLDVQVRRLSLQRDGHQAPSPDGDVSGYAELVRFLNVLNASWVSAFRRASPPVLIDLIEVVGTQFADFMASLDPWARAAFPVAWAGEAESRNWFDVGRDYTELWHHQAQIRWAVGAAPLTGRDWLHPVLALSVRGLPRALAALARPDGACVVVRLEGEAGGVWTASSFSGAWTVEDGASTTPAAQVTMPASEAWKLFFNALTPEESRAVARMEGDEALALAVLGLRSVMV